MKEFLFILRTEGDVWTSLSPQQLQDHIQKGTAYIGGLIQAGKLKSAQPLDTSGKIILENGAVKDGPFNETKEVVAGYFIVTAKDIDEAVEIAKANPIFQDIPTKIEVYPMKTVSGINE